MTCLKNNALLIKVFSTQKKHFNLITVKMNITNATDFFCSLSEQLFINPLTKLKYTGAVQEIAEITNSYWFLDVIASYQKKLVNETFQVWKLERELVFEQVNNIKVVTDKTNSFVITCTDGNKNILKIQKIPFSDFMYDTYTVWCIGEKVILPSEY